MQRQIRVRPIWKAIVCQALAIVCIATLSQATETPTPAPSADLPFELPASASAKDVLVGDEAQLEVRLLVSSGPERHVGLLFDLAEGWHLYWRNPGDTGLAPRLEIEAAAHRVGPIVWPAPNVYEEADGLFTTFGYSDRVLLSMPLEAMPLEAMPQDAKPSQEAEDSAQSAGGTLLRAQANVLICRTECVPAAFSLESPLELSLASDDQARIDRLFMEARAQAPLVIADLGLTASARWAMAPPADDESAALELTFDDCQSGDAACDAMLSTQSGLPFLPYEGMPFELTGLEVVSAAEGSGGRKISMQAERLEAGEDRLRGLVLLEDPSGRIQHVAIDVPIESSQTQRATPVLPMGGGRWLHVLLLALIGGFILNGMPCVLPVLAIKVVAVADMAEKNPGEVRNQGLAYTGGVLGSMAILAGIVVALRSAGHSVGWGFQFQEPLFVATIGAVLVAFAMNLFGVFEIEFGQGRLAGIGTSGSATRRSVFEGLLAVVLATPCTAPFLGTAVGFAFAASSFSILTIFLAIGFGLALPFLAVSFAPGLARFIPRSGPWMMKLRAGLGFSLLATVIWLLWVVGQSGGTNAVIGLASMLLLLAFLLWVFGQLQPVRSRWLARASAIGICGIAFVGFNLIEFERVGADDAAIDARLGADWARYSEEAVAAALTEGRPAFVVFTADWCITCKLNEQTVLKRAGVLQALRSGDYALFKADWTRRDESIRLKLAEFGRAGVPLYLVYSPESPDEPEILSELLSQDAVTAALARSAVSEPGRVPRDRG